MRGMYEGNICGNVSVECICGMYLWNVSVECICGMYLWNVSVECICGMYLWNVSVECICGKVSVMPYAVSSSTKELERSVA
jgi:hypothetical protein